MTSRDLRSVVVLAYDGLCVFEFGIAVEIFGLPRPELNVEWYRFRVCSMERGPIRATGGITVSATGGLGLLQRAGTIVIPGWRNVDESPPLRLVKALQRAHAGGARLVSICSGVFLLAAAGLLDGKRVTTHWRHANRLSSRFPSIEVEPNVLYIDQGNILTSAGSAAGIDLCLHIVRRDYGSEIANMVSRRLIMPPHRNGGQAQYVSHSMPKVASGGLAPVLQWAQSQLREAVLVDDLARRAAMSPRTFARRFRQETGTTPHQWLLHQRLLAARQCLEKTVDPIERIAEVVGFQTAATLRLHFQRTLGTTPTAYRRRFSTVVFGDFK
jgi:AraC family transcriptional activator FtrA